MSSRTRARSRRAVKVPAGATAVRIPAQRGHGRRAAQPFVVVVPERPSFLREMAGLFGGLLWDHRRALAPIALSVLLFVLTGLAHWLVWWSGLLLAPSAAAPLVWLLFVERHRPSKVRGVRRWRITLALFATAALAWAALAAGFGPLSGPLVLLWLLITIAAQTLWLIGRGTSDAEES
ncbi:hypothetical protein ACFXKR_07825 [Streptomyces violascens]|uniref:hypothetical protein n=1 Tax=Streptomyces violascens TaxID=67381 RepID=UPI003675770D